MKNWSFALFTLGFLTSCSREIVFNKGEDEPVLVVYTQSNPKEPFNAMVTHSVGILDTGNPQAVTNATVYIEKEDGTLVAQLTPWGDGFYASPAVYPQPGVNYVARVSATGFKPVRGSFFIPTKPIASADSVGYAPPIPNSPRPNPKYLYDLTLLDDGTEGMYEVMAFLRQKGDTTTPNLQSHWPQSIGSPDPISIENRGYYKRSVFFPAALFSGQTRTLRLVVDVEEFMNEVEVVLYIAKLTPDLFKYIQSTEQYNQSGGMSMFTQPVSIYTNIQNGLGCVGGFQAVIEVP